MSGFREALAFERNDALIARGVLLALDGERKMAPSEERRRRAGSVYLGDDARASKRAKPRSLPGAS